MTSSKQPSHGRVWERRHRGVVSGDGVVTQMSGATRPGRVVLSLCEHDSNGPIRFG